jgi:amino acid transporter
MENQPPYQQSFSPNPQTPLSNATPVLVLGIISIVGCFCYAFPGLICGIIALVLAKKDLDLYKANPSAYTEGSFNNLKAGRVCAIVGLSLSAFYVLCLILVFAFYGYNAVSHPGMWNHLH